MVKVNPGSSFQKAPGHGHSPTWYNIWQHFKDFFIPIILYKFQKDPFCLVYYIIWYFILFHTCIYSLNFLKQKQKGLITLITGCMFQTIALPSDLMHTFSRFINVYSPWAGTDNPLGPKSLMPTGRPHHFGHLLQVSKQSLQPLALYTSFHDLINIYSRRSWADNPQRTKFWRQQKPLVTSVIC